MYKTIELEKWSNGILSLSEMDVEEKGHETIVNEIIHDWCDDETHAMYFEDEDQAFIFATLYGFIFYDEFLRSL